MQATLARVGGGDRLSQQPDLAGGLEPSRALDRRRRVVQSHLGALVGEHFLRRTRQGGLDAHGCLRAAEARRAQRVAESAGEAHLRVARREVAERLVRMDLGEPGLHPGRCIVGVGDDQAAGAGGVHEREARQPTG